jgi:hypothetical protein
MRQWESNRKGLTYSLSDVIDYDGAIGIPIIHRGQRLISLLASCIPDLELDCGALIEGDGLCQEGGADCGLAVIVELILGGKDNS